MLYYIFFVLLSVLSMLFHFFISLPLKCSKYSNSRVYEAKIRLYAHAPPITIVKKGIQPYFIDFIPMHTASAILYILKYSILFTSSSAMVLSSSALL